MYPNWPKWFCHAWTKPDWTWNIDLTMKHSHIACYVLFKWRSLDLHKRIPQYISLQFIVFPWNIPTYKYPISKVSSLFSVLDFGSCLIHESYKYCWQKLLSKCYQMYWTKKMIAFLMMALMMQIADVPNHLWVWCLSSGTAKWKFLESWIPMDWIITSAI